MDLLNGYLMDTFDGYNREMRACGCLHHVLPTAECLIALLKVIAECDFMQFPDKVRSLMWPKCSSKEI